MLQQTGTANVFVTFVENPSNVTNVANRRNFKDDSEKRKEVSDSLGALAASSQKGVLAYLAGNPRGFKRSQSFWLTNQVYIEGATPELVLQLSALPAVARIEKEEIFKIIEPVTIKYLAPGASASLQAVEWGVAKINAPDAWSAGFNGTGVVVGNIDTGVRHTHTALASSYRADSYSWYDPVKKSKTPTDGNGHGTHTMGTMVGSGGIGVAPGAKWIACRGCGTSSCNSSHLLACLQWMYCPTSGNTKDCSKAPRVVNNSWGGGQGSTYYAAAINTLKSGGVIPIFSAGNSGPKCGTANSPGDLPSVIAVGAMDSSDAVASFSSKGPSVKGLMKPDVSAPGVSVRSAYRTSDTSYATMSGTSMAAPHIAGLVALLLQEDPTATYDTIKSKLQDGAVKNLAANSYTCSGIPSSVFPNNIYGHGRVNATSSIAL